MKLARSTRFEVVRRLLAAVADHFIFDHLTLVKRAQAGTLDRGDMNEHISASVLWLNEPIALGRVEPFHGSSSHHGLLACTNLIAAARPSRNRPSEVSVAYGKAHGPSRATSRAADSRRTMVPGPPRARSGRTALRPITSPAMRSKRQSLSRDFSSGASSRKPKLRPEANSEARALLDRSGDDIPTRLSEQSPL